MSRWLIKLFITVAPGRALRRLYHCRRRAAGLTRREITLADGSRYVYLDGGEGEPLMLLHGFGADKDHFTRVASYLTLDYRVIVPDHLGFGESDKPPHADYSPQAQAGRLRMLAMALGVGRLHLGGNSMGGHIALTYAALFPAQVASLWLLSPGGIWNLAGAGQPSIGRSPLVTRSVEDFARLQRLTTYQPLQLPRRLLAILAAPRIANAALEEHILGVLVQDSLEPQIRGLLTPSLIVWGEEDQLLPASTAAVLQRLLPNSRVQLLPKVGHLPMLECSAQVAEDYLRFRQGLRNWG
jgi:pimeloyl-ACP methyl ester carboxylesterase